MSWPDASEGIDVELVTVSVSSMVLTGLDCVERIEGLANGSKRSNKELRPSNSKSLESEPRDWR